MSGLHIAAGFTILENVAKQPEGTTLQTKRIDIDSSTHALLAIDSAGGRHVLVPVGDQVATSDLRNSSLTLNSRELQLSTGTENFADLACNEVRLNLVFERVVEDVVGRLSKGDAPESVCTDALKDWRALFSTANTSLTRFEVIGLLGEIEVLSRLFKSGQSNVLSAWRGPEGSVHDFRSSTGNALEVKTTGAVDANFIHINNIDQLDPTDIPQLHLVVIHVREDPREPSLDERIRSLIDLGMARDELLHKVENAGYIFESGLQVDSRFAVRSVRCWHISQSFPGLRRSEMNEKRWRGVSKIEYDLALDTAPPRLPDSDALSLFANWSVDNG